MKAMMIFAVLAVAMVAVMAEDKGSDKKEQQVPVVPIASYPGYYYPYAHYYPYYKPVSSVYSYGYNYYYPQGYPQGYKYIAPVHYAA